jgi:hypothetical protein
VITQSQIKKGKAKWVGWCPGEKTEDNKDWFVSVKNRELIISDLKGVCMIEKGEFLKKNGNIGFVRSSTSVIDFKKFVRTSEFFWMDKTKKIKRKEKCKKIKK